MVNALTEAFNDASQFTVTRGAFYTDGNNNYLGITDGRNGVNAAGFGDDFGGDPFPRDIDHYNGKNGNFLIARDLNEDGGQNPSVLLWDDIDITGLTNLTFSGLFGGDGNKAKDPDFVRIEVSIDNGAFVELFSILGDGDSADDDDDDGSLPGVELSFNMQEIRAAIAGTGSTLDLRLTVASDNSGGQYAFDDFAIIGDGGVAPNGPLTVSFLDASINEFGGTSIGTVTRQGTTGDVVVTLTSSNPGEATVPATVTIPDGQSSASFPITAIDDTLANGDAIVTITASGTDFAPGSTTITIIDDDGGTTTTVVLEEPFDDPTQFTGEDQFFADNNDKYFGIFDPNFDKDTPATNTDDFGADSQDDMDGAVKNDKAYVGNDGNFLLAEQTEPEIGRPTQLDWTGLDIAGLTNLQFSGLFADYDDDKDKIDNILGDADEVDFIQILVQIDGGGYQEILYFTGDDTDKGKDGVFALDTDGDRIGDGTRLSQTFQQFVSQIAGTGTTLDLRLVYALDKNDEGFAVDEFRITGDETVVALPQIKVTFDDASINEFGGTTTGTVTRKDPTGDVVVTLASSDTGSAIVPPTVTFLDGETTATFTITAVDDQIADGDALVAITAAAPGFTTGLNRIVIVDDDGVTTTNTLLFEPFDNTDQFDGEDQFFALAGDSYTGITDGINGNNGAADDFGGDDVTVPQVPGFNGADESFLTGEDTDANGDDPIVLEWNGIDITGQINLEFSALFGADGDNFDDDDFIRVEIQVDGGGYVTLLEFQGEGGIDQPLSVDTNGDGVGDGVALTPDLAEFVQSIIAAGSTLDLRISYSNNDPGEAIAIDSVEITGQTVVPPVQLRIEIDADAISEDGGVAIGTVTRSGLYTGPLVVALSSDDADGSEILLPAGVTIAAGAASATFEITGLNDGIVDGDVDVTVTAAAGAAAVSETVTITDATGSRTDTLLFEPFDNTDQFDGEDQFFAQDGDSYTGITDGINGNNGPADDFGGDDPTVPQVPGFNGADESFLTGEDTDANGDDPIVLEWNGIDITGYVNIEFSALFGADGDNFDDDDFILVEFQVDGGGYVTLLEFQGEGGIDQPLSVDTDGDGVGDGPALTTDLTEFVQSIIAAGSTLDLRISYSNNDPDEAIAIDSVEITGQILNPAPELTLTIDAASIDELDGTTFATVTRTGILTEALVVALSSDDADGSEVLIPAGVTIAAGAASATFAIAARDDEIDDGDVDVSITAAAGAFSASDSVSVVDDEDVVFLGDGGEAVDTGTGFDVIYGGSGDDEILGGSQNDLILPGLGNDTADGGEGTGDTVSYANILVAQTALGVAVSLGAQGTAQNTFGAGVDFLTGFENLVGSDGLDFLTGDDNANTIFGGNGSDALEGGGGDDVLYGGNGNDGLGSADFIEGGAGADSIFGGDADGLDTGIFDFASYSTVTTPGGLFIVLAQGPGNTFVINEALTSIDVTEDFIDLDSIEGFNGSDFVNSTFDASALQAGTGALYQGGILSDLVIGGEGIDQLFGNFGNDTMFGNGGADLITGSRGNDVMTGGAGPDVFAFGDRDGNDRITDFTLIGSPERDILLFNGTVVNDRSSFVVTNGDFDLDGTADDTRLTYSAEIGGQTFTSRIDFLDVTFGDADLVQGSPGDLNANLVFF